MEIIPSWHPPSIWWSVQHQYLDVRIEHVDRLDREEMEYILTQIEHHRSENVHNFKAYLSMKICRQEDKDRAEGRADPRSQRIAQALPHVRGFRDYPKVIAFPYSVEYLDEKGEVQRWCYSELAARDQGGAEKVLAAIKGHSNAHLDVFRGAVEAELELIKQGKPVSSRVIEANPDQRRQGIGSDSQQSNYGKPPNFVPSQSSQDP